MGLQEDRDFAERLADDLRTAGADVSISSGSALYRLLGSDLNEDQIERLVDRRTNYHWLVGVLSPHVISPKIYQTRVTHEIDYSLNSPSASIALIEALPYHRDRLPLDWEHLGRFDATRDYQSALANLLQHLGLAMPSATGETARQPAPATPAASTTPRKRNENRISERPAPGAFISYSRADVIFVGQLIKDLNDQGIGVWWDHEKLLPGSPDWDREVRRGIASTHALIYVASEDAATSAYVRDELSVARENNVTVFPLWARGDKWTTCAPLGWGQVQFIDARGDNYPIALRKLVAALVANLKS